MSCMQLFLADDMNNIIYDGDDVVILIFGVYFEVCMGFSCYGQDSGQVVFNTIFKLNVLENKIGIFIMSYTM